jgi:hypothetical protein
MESPSFLQTLNKKYFRFEHATTLEDVLCYTVLTAHNEYKPENVNEAREIWIRDFEGECTKCPYCAHCVACMMNE